MSCLILLDNYQGRYYAGGDVIGKVVCSFEELNSIKGIELKLKGWEKNDWKRISGSRIDSYSGYNEFLNASSILHKGGDIGPGTFEYPFTFHLPDNIPSTYKGRDGGISFFLIAAVDTPFSTDYSDKKEIVVISPINFNLMQNQLQLKPVSYSNEEMITCCWCSCGNVTMDVRLEKTAFVPGEVAKVKVDINNTSNERVEWIKVLLGMYIKSMVSDSYESKCDLQVLTTDGASGVLPGRQKAYCFNLEIPKSAQVPNFALCKLFRQRTTLKVKAPVANRNINLNIELDITMGHIPILNPSVPVEQYLLDISLPTDPPSNHQPNTRRVLYPATQNRNSDQEQYSSYTSPPDTDTTYPMIIPYSSLQDSIPDPIDFIRLQCNDGTYFASSPGATCDGGVTDNHCYGGDVDSDFRLQCNDGTYFASSPGATCDGGVTDNNCYGCDVDSGPCCDSSAVDCGGDTGGDTGGCGSDD